MSDPQAGPLTEVTADPLRLHHQLVSEKDLFMTALITRVEEAFLGALLADSNRSRPLPMLNAIDREKLFTDPRRVALYAAIMTVRAETASSQEDGALLSAVASTASHHPGLAGAGSDYLRRLRDEACPQVHNIDAYARLVLTAAVRRQIAAEVAGLRTEADDHPDHADRIAAIADALERRARQHSDLGEPDVGHAAAGPRPADADGCVSDLVRQREDELLAGLLRHPLHATVVAGLVPTEFFTDPHRREVYAAILALAGAGADLVDEVLLEWQIAQSRALTAWTNSNGPTPPRAEADLAYLRRLATMPLETDALNIPGARMGESIYHRDLWPVPPPGRWPERGHLRRSDMPDAVAGSGAPVLGARGADEGFPDLTVDTRWSPRPATRSAFDPTLTRLVAPTRPGVSPRPAP
jgi:hypothetical protein